MISVLILCAGTAERWQNYLGIPKQLAPLRGQPLLFHTVQQLSVHGLTNIHIIGHDPRLQMPQCNLFNPQEYQWTVASLNSTQLLWQRSQIVLLGDVYYTDKTLNTIINCTAPLMFFGCPQANPQTGAQYAELFALKFTKTAQQRLQQALITAIADAKDGGRGKLWELYVALCKKSLTAIRTNHIINLSNKQLFTAIYDLTMDIDSPEDYQRLCYLTTFGAKSGSCGTRYAQAHQHAKMAP